MTEKLTLSGKTLSLGNRVNLGARTGVQIEVRKKRVVMPEQKPATITTDAAQKLKLLQEAQKVAEHAKKLEEERAAKAEKERQLAEEKAIKEAKRQAEEQAKKAQMATVTPKEENSHRADFSKKKTHDEDEGTEVKFNAPHKSTFDQKRANKMNMNAFRQYTPADDEDDEDENGGIQHRRRSLASIKRAKEKERQKFLNANKPVEKISREITVPEMISVQELANRMSEKGADVVKVLMKLGMMVTITQTIDADTAELVATELGHKVKRVAESDVENVLKHEEVSADKFLPRPPVVTVMGHVDHGKTSLLDALRSTHVATGEAGGITQHIGAYQVVLADGHKITFIDTPGHEAFTAMRARGAQITDIVVLVVAADDGVMPQTIEAINHAKAAKVPVILAINKIDRPGANPERVRTELLQHGIVVEKMGGDVLDVEVSAKNKTNLDKLVDAILLQAEMLDLKAPQVGPAEGVVIEARMDKGRGSVATILMKTGTLHIGDIFVTGKEWGKVRSLTNAKLERLTQAVPAQPVEVVGLNGTPSAGDDFVVVEDENTAREISAYRDRKARELLNMKRLGGTEGLLAKIKAGEMKEVPVLIKADVQGSVEALNGTLAKIKNDEIKVNIIHSSVGAINDTDVTLAHASHAIIIGFNVRANPSARDIAKRDGVDIRYYSIIYDVVDDMKKAVEGMLTPEEHEKILGHAEIRQVISISKIGKIAGCMVTDGLIKRGSKVRLLRDNVVIFTGDLEQLKRMKDDVKEVKETYECGVKLAKYDDIKVGDVIESFEMEKTAVKFVAK
ncbi:MAG: translation initiation factor IF-2 [Alphaproteobacteria bacterium]|nr:translation initiation factor IF-2 [Alphaproteobacteria bacterium]